MNTPTTTTPSSDAVTASTPTTKRGWRFWYTIIIITLTVIAMRDDMTGMLYGIPIAWLIWFGPTWLVVTGVRQLRGK